MNSAMTIAVSGMVAASAALDAGASNLVNLESDGPVPATSPQQAVAPAPGSVHQPVAAASQGLVAQLHVNLAQEVVNQAQASIAYRANIAAFRTAEEMEKTLLDAIA